MNNRPGKETLVNFLSKVSIFSKADISILNQLAEKTALNSFEAGENIIRKGDIGNMMYLIFSGDLKVHDGEHEVARLESGSFFGEQSLLDSEPRSMSVTALNPSVLGSISRNDFYEVLQTFPAMTKDIISALNQRLRNQNELLINEFKNKEESLKELVKLRTKELEEKNTQLEQAMTDLKKSQQQLIQSEKLASLGQLTAGIAHEIQNPLNFVNNFSHFSNDLIKEIKEAKTDEERNEIMGELEVNLEKIHHHGKRADSIVKNMLEHSRKSSGEKQPVDLNALCNEYFNLAFHGMRANNAEFNCTIEKNLAPDLPKANVIPQDISRVLINLFNNAFYSVKEKSLKAAANSENTYAPCVCLATQSLNNSITISIKDNGTGIPEAIKEKIFLPFFTTKPTGQGTGLGLSLSYDIVKAHGGDITVNSKEGEGAEFVVTLPV
jgi:two-component system, NtrC family, sensor kinase